MKTIKVKVNAASQDCNEGLRQGDPVGGKLCYGLSLNAPVEA